MRFVCLCPTYGRRPDLIANAVWQFQRQTHRDAVLLFIDDLGTIDTSDCYLVGMSWRWSQDDRVRVMSLEERSPSLPSKYLDGWLLAGNDFDAVAVWDDDDLYLPMHLEYHAMALRSSRFSKPSKVLSTYSGSPVIEDASGRFWGSCAMSWNIFADGLSMSDACRYDQESIGNFTRYGVADTCDFGPPQYIYRWGETQSAHASGYGTSDWYTAAVPQYTEKFSLSSAPDAACLRWYPVS